MDRTRSQQVPAAIGAYAAIYKLIYLGLILVNIGLLTIDIGLSYGLLQVYFIDIAVFGINLLSWSGYRGGKGWGLELEQILSLGRMLMVGLASTIYLAGIVSLYSPVGWILWYKLMFGMIDERHRVWYWLGCGVFLVLESLYFRALTRVPRNEAGSALTEALS
jgi:hypothetical protein